MKMRMIQILTPFMLLMFSLVVWAAVSEWRIGEEVRIRFDGKFAHGAFQRLDGRIRFDPAHPAHALFDVSVDVASIQTGIDLKNKHALGEKWFDAEKFPKITFRSNAVSRTDTAFVVKGELEMKGIKQELAIPFTFKTEHGQATFYGRFKVNRGDFGLGKVNGKDSDSTSVEVMVPVLPTEN